jgi:hypothetical protein
MSGEQKRGNESRAAEARKDVKEAVGLHEWSVQNAKQESTRRSCGCAVTSRFRFQEVNGDLPQSMSLYVVICYLGESRLHRTRVPQFQGSDSPRQAAVADPYAGRHIHVASACG